MKFLIHDFNFIFEDGKETYRSELVEFTVPKREQCSTGSTEVITITDDPIPPDLPGIHYEIYYRSI